MNDEQAKRLMQTLYEEWQCDACSKYAAVWNDGCTNPLHKITEWSWDEYSKKPYDIANKLRKCVDEKIGDFNDLLVAADEIDRLREERS